MLAAAIGVSLCALGALLFSASSALAAPIGYVYAGSPIGPNAEKALQRFQVAPSGSLTLDGDIGTTYAHVGGVAYVKTEVASYLYVYSTPAFASSEGTIDEFKVDTFNGAVTPLRSLVVKEICPEPGNRLFVYDEGGSATARVFSETCSSGGGYGVRRFNVSEGNGELIDAGSYPFALRIVLRHGGLGRPGRDCRQFRQPDPDLYEGTVTSTGDVDFGLPNGLEYGPLPSETQHGSVLAVGDGLTSIANVNPATKTDMSDDGIETFGGGVPPVQIESSLVSAMAYGASALIAGAYEGDTKLETFGINQVASGSGIIDLGQPPTSISPGSDLDPSFIETIYVLGNFVYVGIYRNHTVELLDEPEKSVELMEAPFAQKGAGGEEPDITVSAMSGFLSGPPSGPGGGGPPGIPVSGTAGNGGGAAGQAPKPIGLSGAVARLKSGYVKVSVECGLPCTIAGKLLPPGAKAQSAHAAKPLPFKSMTLPGSGAPAVVKLKFTHAQKKLAASLLAHHEKVKALITVTEAPGGAFPSSATVKVV